MGQRQKLFGFVALGLLLIPVIGSGLAQELGAQAQLQEARTVEALVSRRFTYQGILHEDGVPVTGMRTMWFLIYGGEGCISLPIVELVYDIEVNDGLFNVELPVGYYIFTGQAIWVQVKVDDTVIGCQEILPVPYAIGLRPGARIFGEQPDEFALYAYNWADTGISHGLIGRSNSPDGAGVLATGMDYGADLILGGNADTAVGDNGVVISDPDYASSDIVLVTNDTIRIDLDNDGDGEDADFEIYNKDDQLIFNVDESGQVTSGGSGIAAFPRPAYDSGWRTISVGGTFQLIHNLGGNLDNYVVDLTCKHPSYGRHIWGLGGDANSPEGYGVYWRNLTGTNVTVERGPNDAECPEIRVRIWTYP